MAFSSHASDSTFFVESDEPSQRINMRDAVKMIARNKQEMIANELSRLAGDEYLEDIMQHMRHMEVRNGLSAFGFHSDVKTNKPDPDRTKHYPTPT